MKIHPTFKALFVRCMPGWSQVKDEYEAWFNADFPVVEEEFTAMGLQAVEDGIKRAENRVREIVREELLKDDELIRMAGDKVRKEMSADLAAANQKVEDWKQDSRREEELKNLYSKQLDVANKMIWELERKLKELDTDDDGRSIGERIGELRQRIVDRDERIKELEKESDGHHQSYYCDACRRHDAKIRNAALEEAASLKFPGEFFAITANEQTARVAAGFIDEAFRQYSMAIRAMKKEGK